MARKVIGPTGSRRRRWMFLLCLVVTVGAGVFFIPGALAVHDEGVFQLDGNASTAINPSPTALEDWDLICKANPSTCTFASGYTVPSGTTKSSPNSFAVDPSTSSTDDILKGGTKDDNDMNSWSWTSAKPSPPKDDLTDGFAAEYTCKGAETNSVSGCTGTTDDKLLYFGADRYSNSGSANVAFWFFQKKVVQQANNSDGTCSVSSGCPFVDSHGDPATHTVGNVSLGGSTPGDVLIISAFGPKAQIFVYEWVGPGNATKDYLGTNSCFTAACSLQPLFIGSTTSDCPEVTGDDACALANDTSTASPWVLPQKTGGDNQFAPTDFFEGGLNLTNLGLASACFSSFLINSRASAAGDAELHDKILGQFARCTPNLTTQASTNATNVSQGTAVTDTATVTVTGATSPPDATGTVQFYLCGPISGSDACTSTSNAIGTPVTLTNAACSPASLSSTDGISCAVSLSVNDSGQTGNRAPLGPGRYCFGATASLTNYDNPDAAPATNECFTVVKYPSSLNTAPWFYPNDKATVSTANATDITGSVTFRLFGATTSPAATALANCNGDDGSDTAQGLLYRETVNLSSTTATSKTVNTSNPGTTGTPNSVKVESTAKVYWRVSYSGDTLHFGRNSTCIENIDATIANDTTGGTAPS